LITFKSVTYKNYWFQLCFAYRERDKNTVVNVKKARNNMNTSLYNNPSYTSKELLSKKSLPALVQKKPTTQENWYSGKQYQH